MGTLVEWVFLTFFIFLVVVGWWWWNWVGSGVIENVIKAMQLLAEKCKYMQNITNNFRRFNNH